MNDPDKKLRLAIFPGTFDPITNGHLDIIRRAGRLFDKLVIAVGENPDKTDLLSQDERAEIIREVVSGIPNVCVQTYTGLTVEFIKSLGAGVIIRGIRNSSDLHSECQMALTNRAIADVETVFIVTGSEWAFTSSSLIRQIVRLGGDVSSMVPPQVLPHLKNPLKQ